MSRLEPVSTAVRFDGRILLLTASAELLRRQLAGEDLPVEHEIDGHALVLPTLRDDISTDEITPAWVCYHFDESLGDFPYVGLVADGENPVKRNAVRHGGFVVSVSGRRRGKGSSREASPFAERAAGIRLVIAESHERIYAENCRNLGLLVSTDFELLPRVRRGEAIPLAEFTRGLGPIAAGIVERGGLFAYNRARLAGEVAVPAPTTPPRPMTLGEKILARRWVADAAADAVGVPAVRPGDEGFVRCDLRFSHEYVTPMASIMFDELLGPDAPIADPGSVLFFRDHLTFLGEVMREEHRAMGLLDVAVELERRQREFAARKGVRLHGEVDARLGMHGALAGGSEAICHAKVLEDHALPGQVIVGTDSHTPHAGAIGCVAFGVGTTAMMNAWVTRDAQVAVPPQLRVLVRGEAPAGTSAKDLVLELLRHPSVKGGGAIGRLVEYAGAAVERLSVDERATLTNMTAEVGGFTGIVAPDERVVEFLVRRRGMREEAARFHCAGLFSDPDAEWAETIEIDASRIEPMVALPGDPGNGIPIGAVGEVRVEIAYAGSCTAGKRDDMDMYAAVFADARRRGLRVASHVRCIVQVGSQDVWAYCRERGYDALFREVGAELLAPGCGACINAGPGVSRTAEQVTISAINRNFPGRSGPGRLYLASPYTVAASAIAGRIARWEPSPAPSAPATHAIPS